MTTPDCASWRNPRILLTLSLIFLCGLTAGALAMRYGIHGMMHQPEPYWQEGGKQLALERLTKELDLSPAQAKELETILDDFVMYVQTLQAQMDEVRADGKQRILRILNDAQRQKFEQMLEQVQARQKTQQNRQD